ncbi:MAG: cytidine deaminase [Clostridia bacterium]|nr:cytidine deaminase [Clostridia bacterium]
MDVKELVKQATSAKENAYAPYSKFRVGAAVVTGNNKIYTGVNIENASYGATCCAERTAIYKSVSEGETEIKAVAIASDSEEYIYPCGICRQVLAEFGSSDMQVICTNQNGEYKIHTLEEVLPNAFKKLNM